MSEEKNINIHEKVMSAIREGRLKMKPRWIFVLRSLALFVGFTGLVFLSIFLTSLISFSVRSHGPMGSIRFNELLASFPWWALILAILGVVVNIRLMKSYDFSYKKNFLLIAAGFILAVVFAGWIINYTGLDNIWMRRGLMREFYERYHGGWMMRQNQEWWKMQNIQNKEIVPR